MLAWSPRPARCLAPLVALAALAGTARAEEGRYDAAPPEAEVRSGWNVGFGLGGGELSCEGEGCDGVTEAGSLDLQVGTMLRPRLRALGEIWGMAHTEDRVTIRQVIVTAALQVWVLERLWLRGGVGLASASARYDGPLVDVEDRTENVLAIAGGVGVELVSRRTFALDLQLRGGSGFYDDVKATSAAFILGLTWY